MMNQLTCLMRWREREKCAVNASNVCRQNLLASAHVVMIFLLSTVKNAALALAAPTTTDESMTFLISWSHNFIRNIFMKFTDTE